MRAPPALTETPLQDPRGSAQILVGSTFALPITLLAAPFGPSAMCFLRHARDFGWLDPIPTEEAKPLADTTPKKKPTRQVLPFSKIGDGIFCHA